MKEIHRDIEFFRDLHQAAGVGSIRSAVVLCVCEDAAPSTSARSVWESPIASHLAFTSWSSGPSIPPPVID
jgi:hypothetical protein